MNTMNSLWVRIGLGCFCLGLVTLRTPGDNTVINKYETGYPNVAKISRELHQALDARERQRLLAEPMLWESVNVPYVQPGIGSDGQQNLGAVYLSSGFIQMQNQLAHALALEEVEPGCLGGYLLKLSRENGTDPLSSLPLPMPPKAWSFDVMNHQISYFNQMSAAMLAIGMAHHYLGHFEKYAPQLVDDQKQSVPINQLITEKEWKKAVMAGAINALDCGYGVEGIKALLAAIEAMPNRPAWTLYFLPQAVKLSKISRDLDKMEKKFFLME